MKRRLALSVFVAATASHATAAPLPDPIRAMLVNALATNDPETIAAVAAVAAKTAPDSAAEIEAMVSAVGVAQPIAPPPPVPPPAPARVAQVFPPPPPPPPAWKGVLEVGGGRSTGNSDTLGVYGSADLSHVDGDWTHKLTARAEYQETAGAPTTERAALAYQPRFKLDSVFYAYGLGQYEHDRFLGYQSRYTAGFGFGIFGVERPELKISFDAGPAVRRTEFYDSDTEHALAGRGAVSVKWAPVRRVTFAQDVAVYVERGSTTANSTTAVDTRLFGPLKARFSYNIQYERDAPEGQEPLDTTSRASLVYSF